MTEVWIGDNEPFEVALKRFNKKVQQDGVLAEARRIRKERSDARREERIAKIVQIAENEKPLIPANVGGPFAVVYADPPWRYEHIVTESRAIENQYSTMTLEDMQFAKLMGTRQAIKNYNAMINCEPYEVNTIFSALPFKPNKSQMTFSGCGALNPFQNDPDFHTFGVGSPLLVNGSTGYLIGPGTRNYIKKPNMMTIAPFKGMQPEYMGAFKTSYGLEPICSIALPIPILNEVIFNDIIKSDNNVALQILSLVGREKIGEITYGDVWQDNFLMKFNPEACNTCETCKVIGICPTNAFIVNGDSVQGIDRTRCFNCGACATVCPDAFQLDMKTIKLEERDIPIVLRQSDRNGAIKLAEELKFKILKGEFPLEIPTANLDFAESVK